MARGIRNPNVGSVHLAAHPGLLCCEDVPFFRTRCGNLVPPENVTLNWREVTCEASGCKREADKAAKAFAAVKDGWRR